MNDVIVRPRPIPRLAEPPAIHDVVNKIDVLVVVMFEKVEQEIGLALGLSKMHIGDEEASVRRWVWFVHGSLQIVC